MPWRIGRGYRTVWGVLARPDNRQSCSVQDGEPGARNRVISIGLKVIGAGPLRAHRTGISDS